MSTTTTKYIAVSKTLGDTGIVERKKEISIFLQRGTGVRFGREFGQWT